MNGRRDGEQRRPQAWEWLTYLLLGIWMLLALPGAAFSQDEESKLQLLLAQYVVVVEQQGEKEVESLHLLDPADVAKAASLPGQVLEYALTAQNISATPLSDVVLSLPIPEGAVYVDGSAKAPHDGILLQFSIDKGATYRQPPVMRLVQRAGRLEYEVADPTLYTNLRWVFLQPLAAGEEVTLRYRVQIK